MNIINRFKSILKNEMISIILSTYKMSLTIKLKDDIQKLKLRKCGIIEIERFSITFINLQSLDLSFNQITKFKGLETLTNLRELYLASNLITEINGLETLTKLEMLNLSFNQITEIKGLETLANLQYLNLYNNRITEIKGLETLTNLEYLCLSFNQITEIKGLETLAKLQHLDFSINKIIEINYICIPDSLQIIIYKKPNIFTMIKIMSMKQICIKINQKIKLYWAIAQLVRIHRKNKYNPNSNYVKNILKPRFNSLLKNC